MKKYLFSLIALNYTQNAQVFSVLKMLTHTMCVLFLVKLAVLLITE